MKVSITINLDLADDYFPKNPTGNLKQMVREWIDEAQEEAAGWGDTDFITPNTDFEITVEEID